MGIFEIIGSVIKPIVNLIDDITTTDDERNDAKIKLSEIENNLIVQLVNYEKGIVEAKSKVIEAEAKGESWLQRNWRPITMLTFLVLVVCDSFGLLAFRLSEEAWTLLQIGIGGYVVGRSGEKIVKRIRN
ncbi:MAG: hypothetical protein H6611_09375 [Ignavibacteriales bacterium]|nr:hypothetical protein [Ignavibacteriales bacterium]